jgi:rubrerythrin
VDVYYGMADSRIGVASLTLPRVLELTPPRPRPRAQRARELRSKVAAILLKNHVGSCSYCGTAFTSRAEPLGRSLCPLCLNLLTEKYNSSNFVAQLSREFGVGTDAIKQWALHYRPRPQWTCISCGRAFVTRSVSARCPVCVAAERVSP